jgi:hypothetical protein
MVMDDDVQEEVVCSIIGVATQRRPAEEELTRAKDRTQVSRFCDVSFGCYSKKTRRRRTNKSKR